MFESIDEVATVSFLTVPATTDEDNVGSNPTSTQEAEAIVTVTDAEYWLIRDLGL